MNEELLTPREIFKQFPRLKALFGWTTRDLRTCVRTGLLLGHYNSSLREVLICKRSLLRLLSFRDNQQDSQKMGIPSE